MRRKDVIYWVIVIMFLNIPFILSTGAHNFSSSPESSFVIQDKAGIISTSVQNHIVSINDYLDNKNLANVVILTYDEDITGDKEYFIENYKRTWNIERDNQTFIIAIFPKEIVISVDDAIRPYFSDLLLQGFQRKIIQARQEGNLDEVLLEITQKVQGKLKNHGWIDIQAYKVKDTFSDFFFHLGISTKKSTPDEWIYEMEYNLKKIERTIKNP